VKNIWFYGPTTHDNGIPLTSAGQPSAGLLYLSVRFAARRRDVPPKAVGSGSAGFSPAKATELHRRSSC
jgi:hypothetical protein